MEEASGSGRIGYGHVIRVYPVQKYPTPSVQIARKMTFIFVSHRYESKIVTPLDMLHFIHTGSMLVPEFVSSNFSGATYT